MFYPRIRWQEFFEKLGAYVEKNGCNAGHEAPGAKRILKKMGYKSGKIADVIDACQQTGGFCDCEILLNTAYHFESPAFERAAERLLEAAK